jgi:hypothetical protein
LSSWVLGAVASLQIYYSGLHKWEFSVFIFILYNIVDYKLSNDILEREISLVNPFLLGISVFMGYYSFDISGILYGPLLFCMMKICYDILS